MTELIPNTEDDCIHKTSSFELETAHFIVSINFLLVNDSGSVEETEQFTTYVDGIPGRNPEQDPSRILTGS